MTLLKGNSLLHGYWPGPRNLFLTVEDLAAYRGWTGRGLLVNEGNAPTTAGASIGGTAKLDKDSLTIIGSGQKPTKKLSFSMVPFETLDARAAAWQSHKADWGDPLRDFADAAKTSTSDEYPRLLQFLRNVYEEFEENPPSLAVGFNAANREIGTTYSWYAECQVPHAVFSDLFGDVLAGRVRRLNLHLELAPTLTDSEYAPPSVPVTIGILASGESGHARGWVNGVYWDVSSSVNVTSRTEVAAAKTTLESTDEDFDDELDDTERIERVSANVGSSDENPLRNEVTVLAKTVRFGFVVVLILLALLALVR